MYKSTNYAGSWTAVGTAPTDGAKNDDGKWKYHFAGPNGTKIELRDIGESWSLDVTK